MRILIATNRYFLSGGPERYLFNIAPELAARGHEVVPFALAYSRNEPTPYAKYFPAPPVGPDYVWEGDRPLSFGEKSRLAAKVIFDRSVYDAALRVLKDESIDVVYALQIAHYLAPEVLMAARKMGVPVVWRQSDYQLLCPAYNALRDNEPCVLCDRSLLPALRYRCLKGSLAVTATRVAAMKHLRARNLDRPPTHLVSPSVFLAERLRANGYRQVTHLPTPVPGVPETPPTPSDERVALYVGGLFPAKGVRWLVEAALGASWRLLIVGDTETPDGRAIREQVASSNATNVEMLGHVSGEKLTELYRRARVVVVPSIWFENVPNVILEAQANGRSVVASNLGSLPEVVRHERDGLLVPPKDSAAIADAVGKLMDDPNLAAEYGRSGFERVRAEHDLTTHIDRLEEILRP